MASLFNSNEKPKSKISTSQFTQRLSSLFGYRAVDKKQQDNDFESQTGLRLVKVDYGNPAYRIKQAALGSVFKSQPLATSLNKYLNEYLNETTLTYSDVTERQQRLNELRFAVLNDPFLARVTQLVADEATQLDDQNRLLTIECPSIQFTNACYELFARWGLTQQRIASVCYDLEQYGEAIWQHRVTEKGIERIIPLKVSQLKERLEFSAVHMAEVIAQMRGGMDIMKNRGSKIGQLVDMLLNKNQQADPMRVGKDISDYEENFADMFDTKLFGFEFDDGIIVPPWLITHFRYNPDNSEFFPYGSPPLLMALSPFKQMYSTIALQGLARASSFPVQLYKVKGTEGQTVAQAVDTVNNVREEYENIGVTPQSNSLEVYTVNTKIWVPEGLLSMEVIESKVDMDFTGDLELYQDRVAIACGVPKAYLDQEFGGFGNSGISLVEQYKPFARHVYTIQSSFMQSLGELIRLHFAITGEFAYDTPFIISMRFPAEDMGSEKREGRTASIELANSIIELLQGVLGIEDGEPLPEDVVSDILQKYTFLDPSDLTRWIRLSAIQKAADEANEGEGDDEEGGGDDMDMGDDMGGDDMGGDDMGGDEGGMEESAKYFRSVKRHLKEIAHKKRVKEARRIRLKEISQRYKESRKEIYFQFLRENHFTEWKAGTQGGHNLLVPQIREESNLYPSIKVLRGEITDNRKLTETERQTETLSGLFERESPYSNDMRLDVLMSQPIKDALDEQRS